MYYAVKLNNYNFSDEQKKCHTIPCCCNGWFSSSCTDVTKCVRINIRYVKPDLEKECKSYGDMILLTFDSFFNESQNIFLVATLEKNSCKPKLEILTMPVPIFMSTPYPKMTTPVPNSTNESLQSLANKNLTFFGKECDAIENNLVITLIIITTLLLSLVTIFAMELLFILYLNVKITLLRPKYKLNPLSIVAIPPSSLDGDDAEENVDQFCVITQLNGSEIEEFYCEIELSE
jgi:hypothetical protein